MLYPLFSGGEQGTRLTSFAEKFATQTILIIDFFWQDFVLQKIVMVRIPLTTHKK